MSSGVLSSVASVLSEESLRSAHPTLDRAPRTTDIPAAVNTKPLPVAALRPFGRAAATAERIDFRERSSNAATSGGHGSGVVGPPSIRTRSRAVGRRDDAF